MFKKVVVILFFFFVAFLYLHNLTRDIYSGDIGDLVTAAYVGGVPHPPGYPLFTLVGFILSHLPFPLPVVSRVGLISVFSSFAGLIIYYKFAIKVTKSVFLSLLSTSILSFSYLFWLNAEMPEVFALNNFFALLLFYLAFLFYRGRKFRHYYLFTFFLGLSFTHHQTILFIVPGLLILMIWNFKLLWQNKKQAFFGLLFFVAGFLPYLYVPVAASRQPVVNWDSASNLENFLRLITRSHYGGFAPAVINTVPISVKLIIVQNYFNSLISNFSYQIITVAIVGFYFLLRKDKKIMSALLLAFILSGPWFAFYGANVFTNVASLGIIERFYGLSNTVFSLFIPFGLIFLRQIISRFFSKKIYSFLILSYFLIVPIFMFRYNLQKTDLAKTQIGNELAFDILDSLPKGAVLLPHGDTKIFNVWHARYVLGYRKDVEIINPPKVGGNNFLDQEINAFLQKHRKTKLKDLVGETLNDLSKRRPLFTTYKMEYLPQDSILVPKGLVSELVPKKKAPSEEEYLTKVEEQLKKLRIKRRETLKLWETNVLALEITTIYSDALIAVGDFLDSYYKNPGRSEHYYRRALWIDPENPNAYAGLALAQFKAFGDCNESLKNMRQAIEIYPIHKLYYIQLYILYSKCRTEKQTMSELKNKYQYLFNKDIEKEIKK